MRFSNWQNKFTALWLIVLSVVSIALGMAWFNKDIRIQTNIFALLPATHQDANLERAQQYVSQQLNDKVFVVLDAKNGLTIRAGDASAEKYSRSKSAISIGKTAIRQ